MRYHLIALGIIIAAATATSAQPAYWTATAISGSTPVRPRCSGATCWQLLDDNTSTISIVTSSECLYKLSNKGEISVYISPLCAGSGSGSGWQLLDSNPRTHRIAAGPTSLYQLHDNGAIWRYSGPKWCSGERCWQLLDNPPKRTIISSRN